MNLITVALLPSGLRTQLNLDHVARWFWDPASPREIVGYAALEPGAPSATLYLSGELRAAIGAPLDALGCPRFVNPNGTFDNTGEPPNPNPPPAP